MIFTRARIIPLLALSLLCISAEPATQPAYLAPDNFDFKMLVGDPPAEGSPAQQEEIKLMLQMQADRTPAEVKRCKHEVSATAFIFADVIGTWFNAKDLPQTASFFKDITQQAKVVSGAAKAGWNRRRPYLADPQLHPCVVLEETPSYPSGHATRGMLWAIVLSEIFPDDREALMKRGHLFGTDRTLAGVHYPSDVAAGQKLGVEIAKRMLADPEFRARLDKAKEECQAEMASLKK